MEDYISKSISSAAKTKTVVSDIRFANESYKSIRLYVAKWIFKSMQMDCDACVHYIYHNELPDVNAPHLGFARILYYLNRYQPVWIGIASMQQKHCRS